MMTRLLALSVVLWGLPALAQEKKPAQPPDQPDKKAEAKDQSPQEQYTELMKQFRKQQSEFSRKRQEIIKKYRNAETDEEKQNVLKEYRELSKENPASEYAEKFMDLATAHPKSEVAPQALIWVVQNARSNPTLSKKALKQLEQHHADAKGIEDALSSLVYIRGADPEPLFRKVIETHPDRTAQGLAGYHLASYLNRQARYGENKEKLQEEAADLLKRVNEEYADVEYRGKTLNEIIEPLLFELTRLQIGMVAPDIEGEDVDGVEFKLSDYRGKVVVIDFWGDW